MLSRKKENEGKKEINKNRVRIRKEKGKQGKKSLMDVCLADNNTNVISFLWLL